MNECSVKSTSLAYTSHLKSKSWRLNANILRMTNSRVMSPSIKYWLFLFTICFYYFCSGDFIFFFLQQCTLDKVMDQERMKVRGSSPWVLSYFKIWYPVLSRIIRRALRRCFRSKWKLFGLFRWCVTERLANSTPFGNIRNRERSKALCKRENLVIRSVLSLFHPLSYFVIERHIASMWYY